MAMPIKSEKASNADICVVMERVAKVAELYESRWTLSALRRTDEELHEQLLEQQSTYHQSLLMGEADDIEEQSEVMCRGWLAATRVMELADAEDDAYLLGYDPKTGVRVAIGDNRHSINRVRHVHGQSVVWLTPDEVASLFAGVESFKSIAAVKNLFPGAEIIRLHQGGST